jgi:predicted amidophosphoribosyltransferase
MKSGYLDAAIKRYKFDNKKGWADIFARILVGFFEDQRSVFEGFDLIIASPGYVSKDDPSKGRDWNHTRLVLEKAQVESRGEWPFDVDLAEPAIIKMAPTPRMTNNSWKQRHQIATTELRSSLHIPDRARTEGRTILVYDDVFTDGHTLNEVARCLKVDGGGVEVCGVTLARQPWRKR